MIYHIFGADIPHHNYTVLRFFQQQILPRSAHIAQQFWLVSKENLSTQYDLDVHQFVSKKAIAQAVVSLAKKDKTAQFILHGQFNIPIWLAILFGQLPQDRIYWHIWGADLYEDSRALKFRLFYPLRRLAQKRLKNVLGTYGDLAVFSKINPNAERLPLYFPTKMPSLNALSARAYSNAPTVLLGNSGDPSNRHLQALSQIKQALGEDVRVIVPMGYPENNAAYIAAVRAEADKLFSRGQVEILTDKLVFDSYLALLSECDLGYFIFERQQGIGTMCLLIQQNIPLVLHPNNPFSQDLRQNGIPFLLMDSLSREAISQAQAQLHKLDKSQIAFFAPNYETGWLALLGKIAQEYTQ